MTGFRWRGWLRGAASGSREARLTPPWPKAIAGSLSAWVIQVLSTPVTGTTPAYLCADELAAEMGVTFKRDKSRSMAATGRLAGASVVLAKPMSFMNVSGGPVASLRAFYKLAGDRIVVVHDELDLPFGTVRLKLGGGDNGHNGLRSVTSALGTATTTASASGSGGRRDGWIRRTSCCGTSPRPSGRNCPRSSAGLPSPPRSWSSMASPPRQNEVH